MKTLKQIAKAKYQKYRDVNETSAIESKENNKRRGENSAEASKQSFGGREGESLAEPEEFVRPGSPPLQLLCLEPEFPETFWDPTWEETSLLAKCFIENQYHVHRSSPMSCADRRAFLDQVATLLQRGANPNITICVYEVGRRILHRVLDGDDLQGFDRSLINTPDLVHSNKAQLLWIRTPFLQSLLQNDIDIIVLFLRYGVNA
jgi:hypothetical protein